MSETADGPAPGERPAPASSSGTGADLAALADLQRQFLDSIGRVDAQAPVPWCGRWRVRELVVHLARVHHWAAAQARRERETPLGRGPFDLAELYARCAEELLGTLRELDPAARAWTLLDDGVPREQKHGTVAFWHRRQKLETLVHLWDLRTAGGLGLDAPDELWTDAVAEVVDVMHPRQMRLGRVEAPAVGVRLEAPGGQSWELVASAPGAPSATVSGPARELALLVWGRTALDDSTLTVTGDRAGLDGVLAAGLTP